MKEYENTHFKLTFKMTDWWAVIASLRTAYGDNNPYQKMEDRPWFTNANTIYIRRDLYNESFTTYLFLTATQDTDGQ